MAETPADTSVDQDWDDSVLMGNWRDALEEYKKYHSMAINGESGEQTGTSSIEEAEASKDASAAKSQEQQSTAPPVNFTAAAPLSTATNPAPPGPLPAGLGNMSQALMGSTTNEQLKNMMTAWYYAGYYTGFFEGQSKAWTDMQPQDG